MVDTEYLHHQSFKAVLEQYGITPMPNALGVIHISGISAEANWERFGRLYGLDADVAELSRKKSHIHLGLLQDEVTPMPGLIKLLKNLHMHGQHIAIASSSIREHIDMIIDRLSITHYFNVVVSGDEVIHGKPAPDIYLKAASALGIEPRYCVALEDAVKGAQAASAAGMRVVAVPTELTRHEDFSFADAVVGSLEDVDDKMLDRLFQDAQK